jgi:hypothetical protein
MPQFVMQHLQQQLSHFALWLMYPKKLQQQFLLQLEPLRLKLLDVK